MLGGSMEMSGRLRDCAVLLCACAVAASAAAGCGGTDEESTATRGAPEYAMASEPSGTFAERMAKLLETTKAKRDCPQLEEINQRSLTRFPCPPAKTFSRSMAQFEVVGAKEYGTGAIVDYTSGAAKDGATIVLFAAPDRNWGISRFGIVTEPSTETSDEKNRAGFREAVNDYLAAVRERDCKAFTAVTFTGDASREEVCEKIFPTTRTLAKRLEDDPTAKPGYEGGNASYGFFTLETRKPKPANSTISVVAAAADSTSSSDPANSYLVLDVAASPTAEQQRATIRALQRSKRRQRSEPERSPARKVTS